MTISIKKYKFFSILLELLDEKQILWRTQADRYEQRWNNLWDHDSPYLVKFPTMTFNSTDFTQNNIYRVSFLQSFKQFLINFYQIIQSNIEALFNDYFPSSPFHQTYPYEDWIKVPLYLSYQLLGSVSELYTLNPLQISPGYIIIGKYADFLKWRPLKISKIFTDLKNLNYDFTNQKIIDLLESLAENNILETKTKKEVIGKTALKSALTLSSPTLQQYNHHLKPIVEWIIGIWRSLFNFRELNLTIDSTIPNANQLKKTLEYAATQGLNATYFLIDGLETYFTHLSQV